MLKILALLYEQDFDQETNTFKLISLKGVFLSRLVNKKKPVDCLGLASSKNKYLIRKVSFVYVSF